MVQPQENPDLSKDLTALPIVPRQQIAIHILDDGTVIFGDLPPALAQVRDILAGDLKSPAREYEAERWL